MKRRIVRGGRIVVYDTAQLDIIETAQTRSDWFTAVVLCAIQLEMNGCMKIKDYLESLKVDPLLIGTLLEPLYLRDIAKCLLVMKIIDKKEKDTMMKINTARKYFVHRRAELKFKRGKEADKEYDPLVNEAKRILKEKLGVMRLFVSRH